MKIALHEGKVICAECGPYFDQLRQTGRFIWDRKTQTMQGSLCRITLQALSECCKLPPQAAAELSRQNAVYKAMEEQRRTAKPKLLSPVPIKNCELMGHQVAGVNMALLLFGLIDCKEENNGS